MTFSIVAMDEGTGDLGVAVQSKVVAVGALVPFAKAGVGAVATQAVTNTALGCRSLELLTEGKEPKEVLETMLAADPGREERQVGLIDASGSAAAYTGSKCPEWAGHVVGEGYAVQGNLLVSELTLRGMVEGYQGSEGSMAYRLLRALEEGQKAGGDRRGRQSAAVLAVREGAGHGGLRGRLVDLRVDNSPEPIQELMRVLRLWEAREPD